MLGATAPILGVGAIIMSLQNMHLFIYLEITPGQRPHYDHNNGNIAGS